jgi:hypothetical protein
MFNEEMTMALLKKLKEKERRGELEMFERRLISLIRDGNPESLNRLLEDKPDMRIKLKEMIG